MILDTTTATGCAAVLVACAAALPGQGGRQGAPAPRVMALPTYPVLERGATRIRVDGSLHEWPTSLPGLILMHPAQLSGTANRSFRGPTDLSANGGMVWDEKALYLWFAIQDDWGRPLDTGRSAPTRLLLPPGDSVVLYFDPKRDTRSYGPDPGRGEDREYWIGMTRDGGTLCVEWQRRFAIASRETKAEARALYDRKRRRYSVEVAIPWSELLGDRKPVRGLALDFQVILNDFDEPTDPLPQTRIGWTFGSGPRIDPAIYGTLVLAGKTWGSREPPERPPLPARTAAALPGKKFWIRLQRELAVLPPRLDAEGKRRDLLRSLDARLAKYPLLDHQEMLILMQREMPRELAGYAASGPPYYFTLVMQDLLRDLEKPFDRPRPQVIALPGRGFLVRSKQGNVALSPASPYAELLAKHLDALCFANSSDPLDRDDPLMLRVLARNKPVFCHLSFHLPGYGPLRPKNLSDPGFEKTVGHGIRVRLLGKKDETGRVTPTVGYQLTWADGFTIVHASLSALPEEVRLPPGRNAVDILILDPDHQAADRFVTALEPSSLVLEGFLDMPRWAPGGLPRNHRLAEADAAAARFRKLGARVVLLAPGQGTD